MTSPFAQTEVSVAKQVVKKIDASVRDIYRDILKRSRPSMRFPIRALANVRYDPKVGYFQIGRRKKERALTYITVKTFAQTLRMISTAREAIENDEIARLPMIYLKSFLKSYAEMLQVDTDIVVEGYLKNIGEG